jgi:hypothetical protein
MAGLALVLLACSSRDFNTPALLSKPRILAIQAEPPQPALGASTTLRPLVYLPPPSSVDGGNATMIVTGYSWSWCPLATSSSNDYACPIGQDAGDSLLPGLPSLDLGTGETATFTNPFPASVLGALCNGNLDAIPGLAAVASSMGSVAAGGGLTFNCTIAGFPITVRLTVTLALHTSAGDLPVGDLPAVFTVYLPINDAIAPNVNPVVGGISAYLSLSDAVGTNLSQAVDGGAVDNSGHRLDEAGTPQLVRNTTVTLLLDMPLSDSELLPDPNQVLPSIDPNNPNSVLGPKGSDTERLYVDWFAEGGDFSEDGAVGGITTSFLGMDPNDAISPFGAASENYWNIPKLEDYSADRARVIVVVRDSRGGVTWTSGVASFLPPGVRPDAGASDAPQTDSGEVTAAPDAGAPDTPQADSGEVALAPDTGASDLPEADAVEQLVEAGVPDTDQGNSADAPLEIAP